MNIPNDHFVSPGFLYGCEPWNRGSELDRAGTGRNHARNNGSVWSGFPNMVEPSGTEPGPD